MNERFQVKTLLMATLAAFIGMDGFFSLLDRKIRGAADESAIQAQAIPAKSAAIFVPHIVPQSLCPQNDLLFGDEPELLNNEETAPLIDEEFERIEWNADRKNILRNASNAAFRQKAHQQQA